MVSEGLRRGMIRTGSTDEFKRESKEFIDNILLTMKVLNTTGEHAAEVMQELQGLGYRATAGVAGVRELWSVCDQRRTGKIEPE